MMQFIVDKDYKTEPPTIMEVGSWEVITQLVAEGMGIGYLPDYISKRQKELQEIDLGLESQPYRIAVIYPKGMKLRKSSQLFLELVTR